MPCPINIRSDISVDGSRPLGKHRQRLKCNQ